jgi:hypothetical protein
MMGGLADLNDRMAGLLTRLNDRGFWTGESGESLLLAAQGAINTEKILIKGLGDMASCDKKGFSERVREAGLALDGIGVWDLGIYIPNPSYVELSVPYLVEPFWKRHQMRTDFLLKMVYSVENGKDVEFKPMVERLRVLFKDSLQLSIVMDFRENE